MLKLKEAIEPAEPMVMVELESDRPTDVTVPDPPEVRHTPLIAKQPFATVAGSQSRQMFIEVFASPALRGLRMT